MTNKKEIYKCSICGNIVEVLHEGKGELVCCGQKMQLMKEKTADAGMEKHVPVVEKTEGGILVKIGSVPHPMEEGHYIEWIELQYPDGTNYRKELTPNDKPEAMFQKVLKTEFTVRSYCNLHGLWEWKGKL